MTDVVDAIDDIKKVLNTHLVDAWEATGSGLSRDTQVFSNDFRLTGNFPKVQIVHDDDTPTKSQWGGKKDYNEFNQVKLNVFYYNKPQFKYYDYQYNGSGSVTGSTVYEDGGANDSKSLNRYMLEQIRNELVKECGSLTTINNLKFGSIISTQLSVEKQIYWGYVPIKFQIIKRIGV